MSPILVVDDDAAMLASIKTVLVSAGMEEPHLVSDGRKVMDLVRNHRFEVVMLDLIMPHTNGIEILKTLKEERPETECIMVTAVDDVSTAVEAMRYGAYDYLVKPFQREKLIITIERALERYAMGRKISLYEERPTFSDLKRPEVFSGMVAEDERMALVFHQAEAFADNDYPVLLTGETGTGKELLARTIHRLSKRAEGPFVAVNMAALGKTLIEDELFGHARGAYTGAVGEKKGFFETAEGGVLFLDEITEMEPGAQAKLLRVIQERELYRLGSTKRRPTDTRIISATNRDITREVEKGVFRRDLYYRINVCHIHLPALRERKNDILPLARCFLSKHAENLGKESSTIAPDLEEALLVYTFPGNVRELDNLIASAVILEKGSSLTLASATQLPLSAECAVVTDESSPGSLASVEATHILKVLEATGGNRTQAAKVLGIGLRTLQRKLKNMEGGMGRGSA